MKHIITYLAFLTFSFLNDSPPLELVKRFFNKEIIEYKSVLGKDLSKDDLNPFEITAKRIEYELMHEDEHNAAVAVTLYANETDSIDNIYVFLSNNGGWKIETIRALALPGFYFTMLEKYNGLDSSGLRIQYQKEQELARVRFDSIKSVNKNKKDDENDKQKLYIPDSLEFDDVMYPEQKFMGMIISMRLAISNDKKLIEHFNAHKDQYNQLQYEISNDTMNNNDNWYLRDDSKYAGKFYDLSIAQVYKEKEDRFLRFMIGGVLDNSVGYLYCEYPADRPKISENNFIMLKKISDRWYLYKTS
jgi:hypothetical protein